MSTLRASTVREAMAIAKRNAEKHSGPSNNEFVFILNNGREIHIVFESGEFSYYFYSE